jgi:hypothetical protein
LGDFFRSALRVASRYKNTAAGIQAVNAPHQVADFGIRGGGDGARVQNGHLALGNARSLPQACLEQLLLERCAVRLARPASEIEEMESPHANLKILPLKGGAGG